MKAHKLIAVFLAVFAVAAQAATYYITGSGTSFSASKVSAGGTAIANGSGVAIQNVIDAIKADAAGTAVTIQFGDGSSVLDIGTAYIAFYGSGSASWGLITLTGRIKSGFSDASIGMIYLDDGTSISSTADIENTVSSAVRNQGTGTVTISNGTISAKGTAITNYGTVNITGGTISSSDNTSYYMAIYNVYGTVNISGGTVSATGGFYAVETLGKITVSGTAKVTSGGTDYSTIHLGGNATTQLEITGGTVENTASGGMAVQNASTSGILLSGNPTITGRIMKAGTGILSVNSSFNPTSGKTYTLDFSNFEGVAVQGGATKISNFVLANSTYNGVAANLSVQGSDLVLGTTAGYLVAKSGTTYTITKGTGPYVSIHQAIDNIRTQANGAASTIQFGSGGATLDIGDKESIIFNGAATPSWGQITLAGKITSSYYLVISLTNGASISSTADITTSYTTSPTVIRNEGTGTVTISGGTVSANGYAVQNRSTGTVNITGGTLSVAGSTSSAVYNESTGKITVSGTAKVTSSGSTTSGAGTINNNSAGTIEITGGTVENTGYSGRAIYNNSTGTVSISDGTVSAGTGYAVYNSSTGKITVSGTARVTSKNVTSTQGTIYLANSGSATAVRLDIIGGTVENMEANANARAIYNASAGAVSISGGTVSAKQGYAIYKNGTGTTTLTGGLVFAYGSAITDVIYGDYTATSGTPAIVAWNSTETTNTAFTSANIAKAPEATTAQWLNQGGSGGISYANGTNTGFIPLAVTVSKANPATWPTATAITYGAALSTSALTGGTTGIGTFAWTTPTTIPNVTNNGYSVTFTPTDAANYNIAAQNVNITVNKATGTFGTPAAVNTTYATNLTLADLTLPDGYSWNTSTTALNAGDGQTFAATYIDLSGNYESATGNITVNVAKATGLDVQTPVSNQMISKGYLGENTFDLSTITRNKGDHGELSYTLGTFNDASSILAAQPTLSGATLTYTGTGKESGEATQEIIITSENYQDFKVTITFKATPKAQVEISGLTLQNTYTYNGSPKTGYTGTPASGAYTGSLVIAYSGTGYDSTATPPTNAGIYTLKILVPSDNAYYIGELRHEFTIAKATAATPTGLTATAGQTLASVTLPSGWSWETPTASVGAVGAQTHKANYTPSDPVNYNTLTGIDVSVQVNAETPIRLQIATGSIKVQTTANAITLENLPRNAKVEVYSLQGKRVYSAYPENPRILRMCLLRNG